jgi:hypothetical protein
MSLDKYRQWKYKFENTTPIRGRAVECRPWGQRRTDWEQIVRVITPLGEGYGAKLYDTDCVVIAPNGDMYIKTGGWATPTTAQWIEYRSQLRCYKKYNKVWIDVDGRSIPVSSTPLHLVWDEEKRKYTCDKKIVMQQQVVDKDKIKAVRHTLKDFKAFVKVMMTLSDGWVSHGLLNLHRTYKEERSYYANYSYELQGETFTSWDLRGDRMYRGSAERFLKCMQNLTEDDDRVKLMLMLTEGCGCEETRVIGVEEHEYEYGGNTHKSQHEIREYKYKPSTIVNRIDYIIKKGADVFTMKEVEVTKPMTNLD